MGTVEVEGKTPSMRAVEHVVPMAQSMMDQFEANEHKGGWDEDQLGGIAWQVLYHSLKLAWALTHFHATGTEVDESVVRELAADVANEATVAAEATGALFVETGEKPFTVPPGTDFALDQAIDRMRQIADKIGIPPDQIEFHSGP